MCRTILKTEALAFRWEVEDPFLFCAHHKDNYPKGNTEFGPPEESLKNRNIGNDFEIRDGFRMYHEKKVPGLPTHPHRGFETITIVLEGFVDHSDSHGAAGRYGDGDVQWMTAGSGLQHAEMFPLLNQNKDNPLHLFRVWLNLPKEDKFTEPYYKMLWAEDIPVIDEVDNHGKKSTVRLIAGKYKNHKALDPAPASWAYDENNHVNIWIIGMEPNSTFRIPKVKNTITRNTYYYKGDKLEINRDSVNSGNRFKLNGNEDIDIVNGDKQSFMLLLEGEPIDEPVVAYGPFVMNTMEEIKQAYADFRVTQFGGWPWDRNDPIHTNEKVRFAKYSDGTLEKR